MTRSTDLLTRQRASLLILTLACTSAHAGNADITDVQIDALGDGRFRIDASVRHDDSGWDHYANRWDVLAPDGTVLGSRELLHPHVDEQPFTRSLTLPIPDGIDNVTIVAVDSVHGGDGERITIEVPR